jgi:histidinol-phosphatase
VPDADPDLLAFAVDLARRAGELTLPWFRNVGLEVDAKVDGTPVTRADGAAERFLREAIAGRYPYDAIVGEEEDDRPGTSGRTWILDPIDGTKAFTRGVPLYTNLVAVDDEEGPAVGVINLPALGEVVAAGRGLGCFENYRPVRVNDRAGLAGSYVCSSSFDHWPAGAVERLQAAGMTCRTWGDGYGFALVATGRAEVMVDPEVARWDVAPMPVIMAEAGGRFTGVHGEPDAGCGSGVASNGRVHDAVLALLTGSEAP